MEGVTDTEEMIGSGGRESKTGMKIDLLIVRELKRGADVEDMHGSAALVKVAGVFDEGIPASGELAIELEAGLTGDIAARAFGWPGDGEHARDGPIFRDGMRPGNEKRWVIS